MYHSRSLCLYCCCHSIRLGLDSDSMLGTMALGSNMPLRLLHSPQPIYQRTSGLKTFGFACRRRHLDSGCVGLLRRGVFLNFGSVQPLSWSHFADVSCRADVASGVTALRSVKSLGSAGSESVAESASQSSLRPTTPAFVPASSASSSPANCAAFGVRQGTAVPYACGAPRRTTMRGSLDSRNSIVIDEALGLLMSNDDLEAQEPSVTAASAIWKGNGASERCRQCKKPARDSKAVLVPCCTCATCALGLAATGSCCPVCWLKVCFECIPTANWVIPHLSC